MKATQNQAAATKSSAPQTATNTAVTIRPEFAGITEQLCEFTKWLDCYKAEAEKQGYDGKTDRARTIENHAAAIIETIGELIGIEFAEKRYFDPVDEATTKNADNV